MLSALILAIGSVDLTVYRITPRNYTGLTNLDSGDARGDVYFGLYEFSLPIVCRDDPHIANCRNIPILSIPGYNVYTQFAIEADERFGGYTGCNPDPDNGTFVCWGPRNDTCWDDDPVAARTFASSCRAGECRCVAFDSESVGRETCSMCEGNASWHSDTPMWRQIERLGRTLNGSWFSTQRPGQCQPGQRVGVDCWWRVKEQVRNVNASCVSDRLVDAVTSRGPGCFAGCGTQAANRSSPCFIGCLYDTLVGPAGAWATPSAAPAVRSMTPDEIVAPFLRSFATDDPAQGGCPEVPPCPPPCVPPATSGLGAARWGGRFALAARG